MHPVCIGWEWVVFHHCVDTHIPLSCVWWQPVCVPKEFRHVVNAVTVSKFDPMNRNNWKAQQGMQPYRFWSNEVSSMSKQHFFTIIALLSHPYTSIPSGPHWTFTLLIIVNTACVVRHPWCNYCYKFFLCVCIGETFYSCWYCLSRLLLTNSKVLVLPSLPHFSVLLHALL